MISPLAHKLQHPRDQSHCRSSVEKCLARQSWNRLFGWTALWRWCSRLAGYAMRQSDDVQFVYSMATQ